MNNDQITPEPNDENVDRDETLKDTLGAEVEKENLTYNADDDSFEYDVKSDNPDYDHPDPYNTSVKNGADMNSTYDEANPYDTVDEYTIDRSLEADAEDLAMHIDDGKIVELDPVDELLARTPEDDRDDLDEEGYPKNDQE